MTPSVKSPTHAEAEVESLTAERDQLQREKERLREALTDIGVFGCGMLNQPAAMNGPNEAWLERRIAQYETVARAALAQGGGNG